MLGGFGKLDPVDVSGSLDFIDELVPKKVDRAAARVLDVGAGIGRVTKNVLIPAGYGAVDLLDSSQRFLDTAVAFVSSPALQGRYCSTMTEFDFSKGPWDLIWVQWVAIYLPDADFVTFFKSCAASLKGSNPDAYVVLKENVLAKDGAVVVDKDDASETRSDAHLRRLWATAGLKVVKATHQTTFPTDIFPVYMYALQAL